MLCTGQSSATHGRHGDTSLRKPTEYNLCYIQIWSLWFGVRIKWLTLSKGSVHQNAA